MPSLRFHLLPLALRLELDSSGELLVSESSLSSTTCEYPLVSADLIIELVQLVILHSAQLAIQAPTGLLSFPTAETPYWKLLQFKSINFNNLL